MTSDEEKKTQSVDQSKHGKGQVDSEKAETRSESAGKGSSTDGKPVKGKTSSDELSPDDENGELGETAKEEDEQDAEERPAEADDDNDTRIKRKKDDKSQSGTNKKQKRGSKSEGADTQFRNGSSKVDTAKPNAAKDAGKVGSKHDEPLDDGMKGSATRLPEKGQRVQWKALPGYVDGEVVEILTAGKDVDGKHVKATEDDPRIVLKSGKSGKICVHKPEAVYFE
jgi:hypothetical protein